MIAPRILVEAADAKLSVGSDDLAPAPFREKSRNIVSICRPAVRRMDEQPRNPGG
jgi:hypothetical protein